MNPSPTIFFRTAWLVLVALAMSACASRGTTAAGPASGAWSDARQMVVVVTPGWNATQATLQRFERNAPGATWTPASAEAPVVLGRSGSAWGRGLSPAQSDGPQKREGDGRNPAGVFAIGPAFGYAATATTGLTYLPMSASHYCMDVPDSPLYNRIVDAREVGEAAVQGSSERMRLDLAKPGDERYAQGFVIEHNRDAVPQAGSCIFAHHWGSPTQTTAGCTAMAADTMQSMLAWLRADAQPVFVLLTRADYQRLQHDWGLPPR